MFFPESNKDGLVERVIFSEIHEPVWMIDGNPYEEWELAEVVVISG